MRFLVVCPASLEASAAIDGPVVPACLAAYGLILEALLSIELLFACGENEFGAAILAYQSLVFEHLVYNPLV